MDTKWICETVASGFIEQVVERIVSVVENYFMREKDSDLERLLKKLKTMMSSLTGVLDDAEKRQIRNDRRVESWLDDIQEALFEADDLLDEIETDALQFKAELKVEGESSSAGTRPEIRQSKRQKKWGFFSLSRGSNERDCMVSKIKTLLERFEEIQKEKNLLGLREIEVARWQRLPSTSLVDESEVFGRDNDKEVVIKLLMSGDEKIGVIPIVGMGGIGKTTLAQAVFNHFKVRDKFQLEAWVCVSEEYDVLRVTKTILKSVSQVPCDDAMDLNLLQVKLKESLSGKKFLIALDDVWSEKYDDWEAMRMPFMDGAQGSKIIVTTRSLEVASVMGTPKIQAHRLDVLTDEASWQLFTKHAFSSFDMNPNLERIGREIIKKCNGLPLAIKTLGGLLRSMSDIDQWERVLTSDIWELTDKQSDILPSLRLSYYYLPSHLKRCFAYCSIFPPDYLFQKEDLILLWMAENLLEPNGKMSIEEVGDQYFNYLLSRSFFQRQIDHRIDKTYFVMHDLIVDLANFVSGKYYYRLDSRNSDHTNVKKETRYLACQRFNSTILEATQLRTLLLLQSRRSDKGDLFFKSKKLRVLSLSSYGGCIGFISSISELRHLRFLDLSCTSINNLPNSFSLYNLQTLKLAGCYLLSEMPSDFYHLSNLRYLDASFSGLQLLPKSLSGLVNLRNLKLSNCKNLTELSEGFHDLINLRYLDVRDCNKLTELPEGFHDLINLRYLNIQGTGLKAMPTHMSKLKNLRTLSTFVVGEDIGSKISELGALSKLSGTLHINNLQNIVKTEEALEAKLVDKNLEVLSFEWADHHKTNDSQLELTVLGNLTPKKSLISLEIIRYGGDKFPEWVGCQSFSNLVDVSLSDCNNCVTLPPLGQLPSLKKLWIHKLNAVVTVGAEFYGSSSAMVKPFASLEELEFSWMEKWKVWMLPNEEVEPFPKLRELSLEYCNSLIDDMPCFLPSLRKLQINKSQLFSSSVPAEETNLTPSALKTLNRECYKSLKFQLQQKSLDSLEELSLVCYNGFWRFPCSLDLLPNIRSLSLVGCENLESLWVPSNGLPFESPKSLSALSISKSPGSTLLLSKLSNLKSLQVSSCKDLKSLPEEMQSLLPSLQYLEIRHCWELESFPVMGLPSSLRDLTIIGCDKLVASRRDWNLQRLSNLTNFCISNMKCEDMESFPEEGLLPSTVSAIDIVGIKGLKSLNNKGLQQLTSLKSLLICFCCKLEMITEELPATLSRLLIQDCPLLEDKCQKDTGEYWNKIAHIPDIKVYKHE